MKDDEWDSIMATNLKPSYRLAKAVLEDVAGREVGQFVDTLQPAYASDLMVTGQGAILSIASTSPSCALAFHVSKKVLFAL